MTTEIGIDGSVRCRDENGLIWSWINEDSGLTIKDVNIKHDNCLDSASLYPQYMGISEHDIICDEWISFKKGNERMRNEVLDLYRKIKKDELEKEIKDKVEEEYNNLEVVKRYNELVNTFNASLEELVHEYPHVDGETPKFCRTGYEHTYKYELNSDLKCEFRAKYRKEFETRMTELDKLVNEVHAMLSLSSDKDYQIEVLDKYGITKKGKLNI